MYIFFSHITEDNHAIWSGQRCFSRFLFSLLVFFLSEYKFVYRVCRKCYGAFPNYPCLHTEKLTMVNLRKKEL